MQVENYSIKKIQIVKFITELVANSTLKITNNYKGQLVHYFRRIVIKSRFGKSFVEIITD